MSRHIKVQEVVQKLKEIRGVASPKDNGPKDLPSVTENQDHTDSDYPTKELPQSPSYYSDATLTGNGNGPEL